MKKQVLVLSTFIFFLTLVSASYTPETLTKTKEFHFSSNHVLFVPAMQSFAKSPPLYWQEFHWRNGSSLGGLIIDSHVPQRVKPHGFQLSDTREYQGEFPVSGAMIVEYQNYGCFPPLPQFNMTFNLTRMPPTWQEAKQNADSFCSDLCGTGFTMTDFDMNQWRYFCYDYNLNGTQRSYNFAHWGGSRCEKLSGNNVISCGLSRVTPGPEIVRPPSTENPNTNPWPSSISKLDANTIHNPQIIKKPKYNLMKIPDGVTGMGLTFPFIYSSQRRKIDQSMVLSDYVNDTVTIPDVSSIILTHWNDGTPINCTDYGSQYGQFRLDYLTEANPSDSTLFGQHLADEWCQLRGFNYCASDHLGMTFGHCQIALDGTNFIRATGGYCMKCV
jgi:hypothetical protein